MYPSRPRFQVVPLAILACSLASTSPAQCAPGTPRHRVASDPATVSVAWLTQHFKDPGLVLMQVSDAKDYESAHIPGAQLIAFHDLSTPMESRPMLELPSVAFIDSVLSARGISNDSHVVVYWGGDWESPATRVVFTLDWAGLRGRVSLLDGGLTAWRAAGNPVTTQSPVLTPATFVAHPRSDVVVTAAWVRSHLHAPGLTLIDARDPEFYGGAPTKDSPHPGHIPGAVNLPFTSFTDSTEHFLPADSLKQLFARTGAKPGGQIVAYCHVGQQATMVVFVGRMLGYDVRLYDGSFTEWSTLPDAPVEN